ncbi:MAG: VCBS repeat-containing protein [Deltaproteobacteria bacterium]|nr:VCBS repeat-containing protein [Candidatus Anaeroferrophillus wilburensis]MBN2888448.1 VCBS repeat-containing protein [Deltaproteobacteria bacterium]
MSRLFRLVACYAVVSLLAGSAWALGADELSRRLQPVGGYIVQLDQQGVVIDCGRIRGVLPGDLFSVVVSGPPMVHPVTGQVVGRQEQRLSLLKVVRVDEQYAVTVPLKGCRGIRLLRGQQVKRAAGQRLLFVDASGTNTVLYSRLKGVLPHIVWEEYNVGLGYGPLLQRPQEMARAGYDLYLVADRQANYLYNADYELMTSVPLASLNISAPGFPAAQGNGVAGNQGYALNTADQERALISRYRQLEEISLVVKSMDMGEVTGDRLTDVVFTDTEKIYVYSLTDKGLQYRYRYHYDSWGTIINLQLADIDGDQKQEILVNTLKETEDGFSSFIIGFREGKFQVVASNIPFAMGMVGGRSTAEGGHFLGQTFAGETVFGSQVYRLVLKGERVESVEAFMVPLGFRLPGALYDDINGDGRRELCFINEHNFLEIYQGSNRLWLSDDRLGGSLNTVEVEIGTTKVSYTDKKQITVPLQAYDLDGDGKKELLAVQNSSSMSTSVGDYGFLNKGSVQLVRHAGSGFVLRPLTGKLDGPLQGMHVVGQELFCMLVKRGEDLLKTTGDSYLLAFPLPAKGRMQ